MVKHISPGLTSRRRAQAIALASLLATGSVAFVAQGSAEAASPVAAAVLNAPGPLNTGVPAGTTLKPSGALTVSTDGAVVDGLDIKGPLVINADNVTVQRTRVSSSWFAAIKLGVGHRNLLIRDVEVNGLASGSSGCDSGIASGGYTALRVNVHGCKDGFKVSGNTVIRDSFVHNLLRTATSHNDGLQLSSGSNVVIDHNTIMNTHGQTSAIFIKPDFGNISNVQVTNNYLDGGCYTIYATSGANGHTATNVLIDRNYFGGSYLFNIFRGGARQLTWSNNVWVTGASAPTSGAKPGTIPWGPVPTGAGGASAPPASPAPTPPAPTPTTSKSPTPTPSPSITRR